MHHLFLKMKTIILFLLFGLQLSSEAQNMSKYWMFGDSAGIEFNGTNTPNVINSHANGRGSSVSIADTNGALLFYVTTNGDNYRTVPMNKFNDTLFNGVDITGRNLYNDLTIVPFPNHANQLLN